MRLVLPDLYDFHRLEIMRFWAAGTGNESRMAACQSSSASISFWLLDSLRNSGWAIRVMMKTFSQSLTKVNFRFAERSSSAINELGAEHAARSMIRDKHVYSL
jgi:hypothetical protein